MRGQSAGHQLSLPGCTDTRAGTHWEPIPSTAPSSSSPQGKTLSSDQRQRFNRNAWRSRLHHTQNFPSSWYLSTQSKICPGIGKGWKMSSSWLISFHTPSILWISLLIDNHCASHTKHTCCTSWVQQSVLVQMFLNASAAKLHPQRPVCRSP